MLNSMLVDPLGLASENVCSRSNAAKFDPIALDSVANFLLLLVLLNNVLGKFGVEGIVPVGRLLRTVRDNS
jgi:hypothetical protein